MIELWDPLAWLAYVAEILLMSTDPNLPILISDQRPLRIAIGLAGLQLGGCQLNALDIAKTLRMLGHQVYVFVAYDEPRVSVLPIAQKLGFEVKILPPSRNTWALSHGLSRLVAENEIEIVHVFGSWLARPSVLALWRHPKCVSLVTNWTMENAIGLPPKTPLIVGTEQLRDIASQDRWRRSAVHLMEPPIDIEEDRPCAKQASSFRNRWQIDRDAPLVVIVSRLDREMKAEGVENVMRAVEHIGIDSLRLAIVGDGDAAQDLQYLAAHINTRVGSNVIVMTGAMEDPRPVYSAADLVLAMGGAAIRALAFGKPLIVLGENGFHKVFNEHTLQYFMKYGFYGLGSEDEPIQALTQQMREMLDPTRRSSLAQVSHRVVMERFALRPSVIKLTHVYQQALRQATLRSRLEDLSFIIGRSVARNALALARRK